MAISILMIRNKAHGNILGFCLHRDQCFHSASPDNPIDDKIYPTPSLYIHRILCVALWKNDFQEREKHAASKVSPKSNLGTCITDQLPHITQGIFWVSSQGRRRKFRNALTSARSVPWKMWTFQNWGSRSNLGVTSSRVVATVRMAANTWLDVARGAQLHTMITGYKTLTYIWIPNVRNGSKGAHWSVEIFSHR